MDKLNLRQRLGLASLGAVVLSMGFGGMAFAQTTPETAVTDAFTDVQTLVTGTLAVAAFALVVAVLLIVVGIKWLRKFAKTS